MVDKYRVDPTTGALALLGTQRGTRGQTSLAFVTTANPPPSYTSKFAYVANLTGGSVGKAVLIAAVVWAAASIWSIARWRQRLQREAAAARDQAEDAA